MVALVGSASGIEKRIHSCDKQAAFVHGNGKGTSKDGTGFSIFEGAVAE
jgi:hypothetical protein